MKILWSRMGRGGRDALLNGLLEKAGLGERCVWIVPEPYSHAAERLLAERGGAPVCLTAEVLTFRRICDHILAAGGGLAVETLDAGGRLLVMRRAVRLAAGSLKMLNNTAAKPGFLPGLIKTLDECRSYSITPRELELAGGDKLKDLALIFSMYEMLCEGGALDPTDRVTLAQKKAAEIGYCRGVNLYISDFVSFTPQERLLIKTLADNASGASMLLCGDITEAAFEPVIATAKRFSLNCEQVVIDAGEAGRHPALRHMERVWFEGARGSVYRAEGDNNILSAAPAELYSAPGEAAEVRFAAERIITLARDGGYRWREIALIASDFERYAPLIESIFPQYKIPVFSDRMDEMEGKPLLRCIRAAADCLRYAFRAEDVMKLLRTGLAAVSAGDADALDNYLRRWNMRGWRFSGGDWTRPLSGWHGEPTEKDLAELTKINALRRMVARAVKTLGGGKTAAQCAEALKKAMEELGVPEGIEARARLLAEAGEEKLANECGQMWELFLKGIGQCAGFLQDEPMEAEEFCELCLLVLSGYNVGSIPASLDRLHAGDQGRFPRNPFKVVVYIGASEDMVPARPSGEGVFTAEERGALIEIGCELPPDGAARVKREMYNLYMACALPSERLIVTYPRGEKEDGRADFAGRLAAMFDIAAVPAPPPSLPGREVLVSREALSGRSAAALYGKTLRLSASRVEAYSLCPFAYFSRYGLKAESRPEAGFTPLDVGRELHFILESCAKYAMERGGFAAVMKEEIIYFAEREANGRMDALMRRGNAGTPRLIAQGARLARAAGVLAGLLWEEFVHSRFSPLGFEMFIEGEEIALRGLEADAPSGYKLRGVADRVDGLVRDGTLFLRVADYKTGGKSFSLSDVRNGLSAQMPVYLFLLRKQAAERFGAAKAEAAGVLYVKTRDLLASPGARHSGLLLDDRELLKAMDDRLGAEDGVLPVWFNRDGSFAKKASVVSAEDMERLQKDVGRLVSGTARDVAGGRIDAAPLTLRDSPCDRCDHRAACLFDPERDKARPYEVMI
jgi:ATP-dependent helicase/nuclease subunit B